MNIDNRLSSMYIIRNLVILGMTLSLAEAIGIKIWFLPEHLTPNPGSGDPELPERRPWTTRIQSI